MLYLGQAVVCYIVKHLPYRRLSVIRRLPE